MKLLEYACKVKLDHALADGGAPNFHTLPSLRTPTTLPEAAALAIMLSAVTRGKLMPGLGTVHCAVTLLAML
jgi:hypothetical protein